MSDFVSLAAVSPACSITDTAAGCYTASWYLIWDQVRYWLLIQAPVVVISIVYEWLELASHRYVERLRKICDSPLTNVVVRSGSRREDGRRRLTISLWLCAARTTSCKLSPASMSASTGVRGAAFGLFCCRIVLLIGIRLL
jgi:hypothetical protein